jgi:hypothetical protein
MEIMTSRKFEFRQTNGFTKDPEEKWTTADPGVIHAVPDWVTQHPDFQLHVINGLIKIISGSVILPVKRKLVKPDKPVKPDKQRLAA